MKHKEKKILSFLSIHTVIRTKDKTAGVSVSDAFLHTTTSMIYDMIKLHERYERQDPNPMVLRADRT
jgi:hypothetical protein